MSMILKDHIDGNDSVTNRTSQSTVKMEQEKLNYAMSRNTSSHFLVECKLSNRIQRSLELHTFLCMTSDILPLPVVTPFMTLLSQFLLGFSEAASGVIET